MVDFIDRLTENLEKLESFKKPSMFEGESSTHCKECGDSIPERRRKNGNIHHCVSCAGAEESVRKHRR